MGWDIVTYGDRHAMLHDMQLWSLRHFLVAAAEALAVENPSTDLFGEARIYFAEWDWIGPGVVSGIELETFVRGSPERERVLVQVCDRAVDRLREVGEVVPLPSLEANINADVFGYAADRPAAYFIEGIERIRGLLAVDGRNPSVEADDGT